MRVLLTNNTLDRRAGTELYVLDVARELQKRGHQPVAFSQRQGAVAASLRACGVPVVDDPRKMGAPPDIIHGQHHIETLIALTSFPGVPALSVCHGWAPWQEEPLRFPRVLRYVAVDQPCWEKLVLENGIPAGKVELLLNFVDMERFRQRSALPGAPRRALAFGNYFSPGPAFETLRSACLRFGIQLDAAGMSYGRTHPAPGGLLRGYDLVFAKARSALEAMAVGAAVILCGPEALGPMVSPENFTYLRRMNFGFRTLDLPYTAEEVARQIRRYDAGSAAKVSELVRVEAPLSGAADRLCALYEEVMREGRTTAPDPAAESAAVARYLLRWAPRYKKWELGLDRDALIAQRGQAENEALTAGAESARLRAELDLAGRMLNQAHDEATAAHAAVRNATEELTALRSRHAAEMTQAHGEWDARHRKLNERIAALIDERDDWRRRHEAISTSATWRLSSLLLQSRAARALAMPIIERLGRLVRRTLPQRGARPAPVQARRSDPKG